MIESTLQTQVVRWLKGQGAYVIKTRPGPGTPVGCPDIIGFYRGSWFAIEVKASSTSTFRPGQERTLQLFRGWSPLVYVVHPDNWETVKGELFTLLCLS